MSTSSASSLSSSTERELPWIAELLRYNTMSEVRECLWGFLFATPWLLGLLIFMVGPIIASMGLSFSKYDIITDPEFLGIDNYTRAFFEDELFWPSLGRTFRYAVSVVPFSLAGSLGLAMLLNQGYPGTNVFRTLYFLPNLTPAVAMAILWRWLFQPSVGPINYALRQIGIQNPPGWMSSPKTALNSLVLVALWGNMGGTQMLIFLAGLQGVPQELYDASDVDGANRWQKFRNVTLPMVSPTIFFNLIMGIIGALQVFSLAYVATDGGPSKATWFYALHLYNWAFQYFEMGYASALAWIFTIIVLILTLLQFKLSERWVYYAGG